MLSKTETPSLQQAAREKYRSPRLHVSGRWIESGERRSEPVINPFDETQLGKLPFASTGDLREALSATTRGFAVWKNTSPNERSTILRKAATLLRERTEEIAETVSLELGKPIGEARIEVGTAASDLEWFAEEGRRSYGRIIPTRFNGTRFTVVKEPVGPVAAFSAWNFPVVNAARKLGAALAAGCSCIYKAGEDVPSAALSVIEALVDAGVPEGVVGAVFGDPAEISEYLIASSEIRKISFTGSVPVGKHLVTLAAKGMKRTTMELGGHAPVIVFDDVNVSDIAQASAARKYRNAGQVCVSPTRFLVHEHIHDRFVDHFAESAAAIKVGDPLDETTQMGPLAHKRRIDAIEALVEDAVERGAQLVTGGNRLKTSGYFFPPTVLANVPIDARIMNEEPFGPVAIINQFSETDEAIREANRLPFGLAAYAFTQKNDVAISIADHIEAGMVGVNSFNIAMPDTPFGGVKESGHGSEGGIEGVEACQVLKTVSYT